MDNLHTMPQAELDTTDHPTAPNNSQNATSTKVTLDFRKYILLLASLVATVTYAAGFSPPGGVWQDTASGHLAGDPIIRHTHHKRYVAFFYCNATAFAASLVVIVVTLILAYLDDNKAKYSDSNHNKIVIAHWTLQVAMVLDLLSLMAAYVAGTCRDTFTTVYSSVLVGFVIFYLVVQVATAYRNTCFGCVPKSQDTCFGCVPKPEALVSAAGGNPHHSGPGRCACFGWVPEPEAVQKEEERPKWKKWFGKTDRVKVQTVTAFASLRHEVEKPKQRFRKILMLIATFAVSITYLAGLSMPGGFWDSAGAGHVPGDAILKDRHNTRLAVFFGFNTLAFVASLLIIVVLLDTKTTRSPRNQGLIFVALLSLIVAYNAGSCRQTDTTIKVFSLIPAFLLCISLLYFVADPIDTKWNAMKDHFRPKFLRCMGLQQDQIAARDPSSPSTRNDSENTNDSKDKTEKQEAVKGKPTEKQKAADKAREDTNDSKDKTEEEEAADKARSLVLLLATLAATITYQAGLDPPGGVWQDNSGGHTAGDPILLTTNPRRYKAFFYCNSVSLVASLVAIVLVQSKSLLKHHVLEAVMILDLFGLIGAYAAGSSRDVNTSLHAMALAGAVLVYVVIHVIFITLDEDDDMHTRTTESDKEKAEKEKAEKEKRRKVLVEKTRKRLLLFAILAATITYQAGLTPPGGFLLKDDQSGHHAGDPVLLYNFPRRYKAFFYCNSVSFMLSIALILLLVNPNMYRPAIRTHALSVCTAVGFFGLMGAYAAGSTQHLKTSVYIFVLVAVVIFFIVLLFLVFWFTSCRKTQPGSSSKKTQPGTPTATETNTQDMVEGKDTPGTPTETTKDKVEGKVTTKELAKHKYLMLLGILVASVTYQAGLKPPGGAWQNSRGGYDAGDPVMHDNRRPRYLAFFYSNSTSFMASVSVMVILVLLLPPKQIVRNRKWKMLVDRNSNWNRRWLVVMNIIIVLDLLGLLGAYAAGSSRRWKTTLYVLLLVIAVLVYMAFHLLLSCIIIRRRRRRSQNAQPSATHQNPEANATSRV